MPSAKSDARWRDAILLTIALWSFVALIFLPGLINRHADGSWFSLILDVSTFVLSMALGLGIFACFRGTIEWPNQLRAPVLGAAVFLAAIAHATFDLLYTAWVAQNVDASWVDIRTDLSRGYDIAFRYLLVFSVNLALFQLSFVHRRSTRGERQLTDARSAAQQAQLQALRYQLNPHFLFNTLNSISSLIVTKRNEDAEQMTSKLSSFLRSSLTCDPAALVPLDEELALIEEYLDIEGVRFGSRLNVEIEVEPAAGAALIPSFLVQPLVENAIKHGVAPSREPVTITIEATLETGLLCIKVANCLPVDQPEEAAEGAGVGLVNVRQRLQAVFGEAASLNAEVAGGRYVATICIPNARSRG
jgi:signal transduction histidine kinase